MALTFTFGNYNFDPRPSFSLQTSETHISSNQEQPYSISKITLAGTLVGDCAESLLNQAQDIYALYNTVQNLNLTNDLGASVYSFASGWVTSVIFSETPNNWSRTLDYSLVIQDGANGTGILTDPSDATSDGTYTVTLDTIPNDSQYGDIYKVSVSIAANGLVMTSGQDNCTEPNKKARQSIDRTLKSQIVLNSSSSIPGEPYYLSVFGFDGYQYSFFNIDGTTDFDDYTGSYTTNISWIMKDAPNADPYYSDGTVRLTVGKDFTKKIIIEGTFIGLSSGLFGRSVDTIECSGSIGGGDPYEDRYENAKMGFDSYDPLSTVDAYKSDIEDLIPEDSEWDGGRFFSKSNQSDINKTSKARSQIGHNPYQGTISYSYEYDDQPEPYVDGAYLESLVFNGSQPHSSVDTIQVLGRRLGPIVSWNDLDIKLGSSTVTYEGYFSSSRSPSLKKYSFKQSTLDAIDTLVYGYGPDTSSNNVTIVEDKQDLNLTSSKVTRTITWNYTKCRT